MNDSVKKEAQEQAEQAFQLFLRFMKLFSYICVVGLLVVAGCNFGVDGTGGGYDPSQDLKDEYRSNMGLD
tara:strand:+ start:2491 stop:2700 length:210 start_codon:yes stop_codon:yes gene_type:complete